MADLLNFGVIIGQVFGPLSVLATNPRAIDNNCLIQAFWPHSGRDIDKLKSCLPDQFIDHITIIPISNSTGKRTS